MNRKKIWFWLMTVTSVIYILWRLFFTLPINAGIVALIAGIALFLSEFSSYSLYLHEQRQNSRISGYS